MGTRERAGGGCQVAAVFKWRQAASRTHVGTQPRPGRVQIGMQVCACVRFMSHPLDLRRWVSTTLLQGAKTLAPSPATSHRCEGTAGAGFAGAWGVRPEVGGGASARPFHPHREGGVGQFHKRRLWNRDVPEQVLHRCLVSRLLTCGDRRAHAAAPNPGRWSTHQGRPRGAITHRYPALSRSAANTRHLATGMTAAYKRCLR